MADQDNKTTTILLGCLGLVASPALMAWCLWLNAWACHIIWQWYPPLGFPVPTVASLVGLLTLIRLARGVDATKRESYGIWQQAFLCTFVPLFCLLSVALVRWCSS